MCVLGVYIHGVCTVHCSLVVNFRGFFSGVANIETDIIDTDNVLNII